MSTLSQLINADLEESGARHIATGKLQDFRLESDTSAGLNQRAGRETGCLSASCR